MLREFQIHRAEDSNYLTDGGEEAGDKDVPFWKAPASEQLSSEQQKQLRQVLTKCDTVLCNRPVGLILAQLIRSDFPDCHMLIGRTYIQEELPNANWVKLVSLRP